MASSSSEGAILVEAERVRLINKIIDKLNTHPSFINAPKKSFRTCYACLWLADIEKLQHWVDIGQHYPELIYNTFVAVESEGKICQNWMQQVKDAESKSRSAPPTPGGGDRGGDTASLLSSSPVPGWSPGDLPSATSTPQRQPMSLGTSGSPSTSRKRQGEAQSTPKASKKLKLDTAVVEPPKTSRSKEAPDQCKERDKACVVTEFNVEYTQACHLYPYCMNTWNRGVVRFFDALRYFWSEKRVDEWQNAVYGDAAGTEKVQNHITLSLNAHQLHTKALFVLEPVTEDEGGMWTRVRFWWLKKHDHEQGVKFGIPPQLPKDFHPKEYAVGLWNVNTSQPLVSGQEITIHTHDPKTHPVPDSRLLQMQWMMNRVIALRGGAEPEDLDDDESDEGSDGGLDCFHGRMLRSPILPGKSSPPSSVNLESDPPKASVIATTDALHPSEVKE